jgi:carbamoyl-phosphate synthase large subunit
MTKKTILITGVGGAAGRYLIQMAQKNDFQVVAVDANPKAYGLLFGDVNIVVPDSSQSNFLPRIQEICSNFAVDFIYPLIDEEIIPLKSLESDVLKVICPNIKFVETAIDKYRLMKELSRNEIDVPKTFLLGDNLDEVEFPAIIKPRSGRGSRGIRIIENEDDLKEALEILEGSYDQYIIQSLIQGNEYTISVVANSRCEFLAVVSKKIIDKKGITRFAVVEKNDVLWQLGIDLVKKFKLDNPVNVQLIINKIDSKPYIFEINPRFSTTVSLTIEAGVNEFLAPLDVFLGTTYGDYTEIKENLVMLRGTLEEYIDLNVYDDLTNRIVSYK